MRVRFAPSPTGALHIGGIRTAICNYLLARRHNGVFILRIEDTDQNRYVPGAEAYIIESLKWCGLTPDEGPGFGGDYGPYRQSERMDIYREYAEDLIAKGEAYYAFDTPEELEAEREKAKAAGNHAWKYDAVSRETMRNSLTLSEAETRKWIDSGAAYVIRLKVPVGRTVHIRDEIRGDVHFQTEELDDKVMLKADGMPTYHLANVVDDHLMKITHVIRGEEWLPSTAHHVLLYQAFGWEDTMPVFAHLPLILKPDGKGKLSKRDGVRLGIPVFPISWKGETAEDSFTGFREAGFDPRALVNFLALLSWNPGTEQELFSREELIAAFSLDKVGKAGARFDIEKAKWFNQQYLLNSSPAELAALARPFLAEQGFQPDESYLQAVCGLMRERVTLLTDFGAEAAYFFGPVRHFDTASIAKKWNPERKPALEDLGKRLAGHSEWKADSIKALVEAWAESSGVKFGEILPLFRLALAGTMKGPGVFEMMEVLGSATVQERWQFALDHFDQTGII